jgi:hypothetical protein
MPKLPFSESCERNKIPILQVLKEVFPVRGKVLEIGSCSGQHMVYFAPEFPGLTWQPSDCEDNLPGLEARIRQQGTANVLEPISLDVTESWPGDSYDVVYSSNTAHIMAWEAVEAMFAGVGTALLPGGVFCLYGPFNEEGSYTSASNREFDRSLRARNPSMGIRNREALESLARGHQMELKQQFRLPANNCVLVFHATKDEGCPHPN